jgi:ABC-type transport system substrate-binding protein
VIAALACAGEEKIVEVTRVVEKPVAQTVVVEKEKIVEKEKQVQVTKIVEKPVEVTKIVQQTVQVEKKVEVTKVVEKPVEVTKVVQQTVVVVQTATATPIPVPKGIEQIPAPNPKSAPGIAVFATGGDILDQNGRNQAQSCDCLKNWGIGETMFMRADDDTSTPWLASAYKVDVTGGKYSVTLTIQKGVKFQTVKGKVNTSGDWGEMTAEDVAWSMNDANAITNPQSIHGQAGDFNIWGKWNVVDPYTIKFEFISFDSTWDVDYLNESGQAFNPFSKKAFDTEGADWVRDNIVATGPYQVESWTRSDKMTMVSRYTGTQKHWKPELTPLTQRIQFVYVPDSTTRIAMMTTGEADITGLTLSQMPPFTKDGKSFGTTGTGGSSQFGIFFAGNLWEKVDAKDGKTPLIRGTYVHDFAQIGNPDDAADMEEARQVRWALSTSYDREAINKAILQGLGWPAHVEYVSIKHPRYQKDPSKGWQNANGTANLDNLKWPYKFDVAAARAMIMSDKVQGNYQKGSAKTNGPLGKKAFEISLYSQQPHETRAELQDAVAGYWTDLGLLVYTLKFNYVTFRPTVVGRTAVQPWVTECDKGNEANPWHFPKGLVQTSLTRGGFGCGFEIPFVLDNYRKVSIAPDVPTAQKLIDEYVQYMWEQALQPGIVSGPNLVLFNTKKVKQWPMPKCAACGEDAFWDLELQPGK